MAKSDSRPIESPRDAEIRAQEWMRYFGYRDASVTQQGADRGIDVVSKSAVAQVKFWTTKKVGRPDIQMLKGAARGKPALFFSSSGYSQPAIIWAHEENIALFVFDASGNVEPLNHPAVLIDRAAQNLGPPLDFGTVLGAWFVGMLAAGLGLVLPIWILGNAFGVLLGAGLAVAALGLLPTFITRSWQESVDEQWRIAHGTQDEWHL